ncbi:MAG TPA: hypothetical protein VGJ78_05920 [Vicinamibacterales bacterium]
MPTLFAGHVSAVSLAQSRSARSRNVNLPNVNSMPTLRPFSGGAGALRSAVAHSGRFASRSFTAFGGPYPAS